MEKMRTPEEIAKIEKERTLSDTELIKGGAKYVLDEEYSGPMPAGWGFYGRIESEYSTPGSVLEATKEQVEGAMEEMNKELINEQPKIIDENSNIKYFKDGTPIDYIVTEMGSTYNYLSNGQTQRFKKVKNKMEEPQDVLVFVPDWEWIKQNMPKEYQDKKTLGDTKTQCEQIMLEYVQDPFDKGKTAFLTDENGNKIIKSEGNVVNVDQTKQLFLQFGKKDKDGNYKGDFLIPVSKKPIIGYNTYDERRYEENGESMRERHLGNKVVKIVRK